MYEHGKAARIRNGVANLNRAYGVAVSTNDTPGREAVVERLRGIVDELFRSDYPATSRKLLPLRHVFDQGFMEEDNDAWEEALNEALRLQGFLEEDLFPEENL